MPRRHTTQCLVLYVNININCNTMHQNQKILALDCLSKTLIISQRGIVLSYLTKGTFANQGVYFISVHPFFTRIDNIIMICIIISIIVCMDIDLALFVPTFISLGPWGSTPLLLCIVNLQSF